jgi:hypothetical protein
MMKKKSARRSNSDDSSSGDGKVCSSASDWFVLFCFVL